MVHSFLTLILRASNSTYSSELGDLFGTLHTSTQVQGFGLCPQGGGDREGRGDQTVFSLAILLFLHQSGRFFKFL